MKKTIFIIVPFLVFFGLIVRKISSNNQPALDTLSEFSGAPNTATQSTDSDIENFRKAMVNFRTSLSPDLLKTASTSLNDQRLTEWSNVPPKFNSRDGINYGQLTSSQLTAFKELLQMFLSSKGYQKVNEITVLAEGFLNTKNPEIFGPDKYHITLFGDPINSGSWGFQLDGHHCAINFLVHGDNVSIVPTFMGAEPIVGAFNNVSFDIFKDERDMGLSLYRGLTTVENKHATSTQGEAKLQVGPPSIKGVDTFAGNYDYSQFAIGLKFSNMSETTQANMILLMKEYVYNLNTKFADVWWNDIIENIDETYFVWIDNVETPSTKTNFYYRIYNPYLWAEFNVEPPVEKSIELWNHAHSITRIPNNPKTTNGGDYGQFDQVINNGGVSTMYEHYLSADHHTESRMFFDYKVVLPPFTNEEHEHSHTNIENHTHS